ncbi:methyl-accepting chemotaxis protein [Flexibacter flexilis DSM 6793]|uniref:Methyl-accepting chemotaxis protein n=1 Tax=Flexibacter flexilis DSM 6793 TaxID=927664 RepID=A0A1I1F1E8_9BACT|nr:PAS domain S-box protein [Flexibacter flexilis]SFB93259.1 methyl-accepting chemotaxis protein [Flexibacter flexilis DSM 6793]
MFKNPFSLDGRIRRKEYGITLLFSIISACILHLILSKYSLPFVEIILMLPLVWLALTQGSKRCHDLGVSGWFQFIPFYPFVMLYVDGQKRENDYGLSPKYENVAEANIKEETQARIEIMTAFAENIGTGNFDVELTSTNDDDKLTLALVGMRDKLRDVNMRDQQRRYVNDGLAQLVEIMRSGEESEQLYHHVLSFIIKYLDANQGGLFLLETDSSGKEYLEMVACYAFNKRKHLHKRLEKNEGLVGQCIIEKDIIYMTKVPQNYVQIRSGLGGSTPSCLLIVPLKYNDKIYGALEIAAFKPFEQYRIHFVERLAESLASTVSGRKTNEQTLNLLNDAQMQAEQMRAQEEEMRQNMEELQATQEEMERKEREHLQEIERLQQLHEDNMTQVQAQNDRIAESEKQLKKMSAEMQSQLEAIENSMLVVEFDMNRTFVRANDQFLKLFGYTPTEMHGMYHKNLLPAQGTDFGEYEKLWETLWEGKSVRNTFRRRAKDGSDVWLEGVYTPIKDEQGRIIKILKLAVDVTKNKQLEAAEREHIEELRAHEEELRQNMEEMKAIQENLNKKNIESLQLMAELNARIEIVSKAAILSESDTYGNITLVNEKMLQITGYTREELIGKPHSILRHPETPKEVFKEMWATIKAGKVFQGIYRNRRKDGSTYWVDATIAPVMGLDGKPEKYISVRFDITQAKEAEIAMTELLNDAQERTIQIMKSEAELEARIAALNETAILSEADIYGNITFVNKKLLEITGYTEEELIGKPHNILRHPETPKEVFKEMWATIKAGKIFRGKYANRKKDGSAYWVDATIAPVLDMGGNPEKYIGIRFDMTESVKANQEIRQLFEESQQKTEELLATEEEIRQNMEEMKAIQESVANSEAKLKSVLDSANFIIMTVQLDGIISYLNPVAEKALGYKASELVGKQTPAIFHDPAEVIQAAKEMSKELGREITPMELFVIKPSQGQVFEKDWTFISKNKKKFPVHLSLSGIKDGKGNFVGFVGIGSLLKSKK